MRNLHRFVFTSSIGTIGIPLGVMSAMGRVGDVAAAVLGRHMALSSLSIRLMHIMSPMDHGKRLRSQ